MTVTAAEILTKTADCLQRYGWQQGNYGNMESITKGPHCADGALSAVMQTHVKDFDMREIIYWRIREAVQAITHCSSIVAWNDDNSTTKEAVIKTLREAAKSL